MSSRASALRRSPPVRQKRRREATLLDLHHKAWLGSIEKHRRSLVLRWARGFIHGARVLLENDADASIPALRALLGAPAVRMTLAELRLRYGPPTEMRAGRAVFTFARFQLRGALQNDRLTAFEIIAE